MISLTASADYGLSGQYIARINGRDSKFTFNREFIGRKGGKRNEYSEADVDDPGLYECCDIEKKHGKNSRFVAVVEVDGDLIKFKIDKEDAMIIAKAMDAGRSFSEIVVGTKADREASTLNEEQKYLKNLLITEGSPDWQGKMERPLTISQKVGDFPAGTTVDQKELQPIVKSEMERLGSRIRELADEGKFPYSQYEIITAKEAEKRQASQTIGSATEQCWAILQSLSTKDAKKVLAELKTRINPPNDGEQNGS